MLSEFIAQFIPLKSPPILVLSLPRSGSSWIGATLGAAPNAIYLREPITQSLAGKSGHQTGVIAIDPVNPLPSHQKLGSLAFMGVPVFEKDIIQGISKWSLLKRRHNFLVIKEVNPLGIEWFIKQFSPRIIFLTRHPAAVAASYKKLGWITPHAQQELGKRIAHLCKIELSDNTDFWTAMGHFQGAVLQYALQKIQSYDPASYTVTTYESLCANPVSGFKQLFNFSNLNWNADIETTIVQRSSGKADKSTLTNPYTLIRNSHSMIDSWKDNVEQRALDKLHTAYSSYKLPYYGPEEWAYPQTKFCKNQEHRD